MACQVKSGYGTQGATSLNRILWVLANLLFEKGSGVEDVHRLTQAFISKGQLRVWFEKYRAVNGWQEHTVYNTRIPLPPIDWSSVSVEQMKALADMEKGGLDSESSGSEPGENSQQPSHGEDFYDL